MFIVFTICFSPFILFAQGNTDDSSVSKWSFSASGYYYFIPDEKNSSTLIAYADHKALHFEARYNYEDQNTASLFAGWRFETGKSFQFGATPMMGIAFGNTNGIVPAVKLDATYKIFDFYSESEYLINFAERENNFFYTWSELAVSPFDFLRTGISAQKTRLYETGLDVQRGIFAEYSFRKLTAGVYYFNPFSSDNFVTAALSIDF
ncbi:MAG TPA: hypothetical protein VH396_18610 [Chitinophagaceae bacterium]